MRHYANHFHRPTSHHSNVTHSCSKSPIHQVPASDSTQSIPDNLLLGGWHTSTRIAITHGVQRTRQPKHALNPSHENRECPWAGSQTLEGYANVSNPFSRSRLSRREKLTDAHNWRDFFCVSDRDGMISSTQPQVPLDPSTKKNPVSGPGDEGVVDKRFGLCCLAEVGRERFISGEGDLEMTNN